MDIHGIVMYVYIITPAITKPKQGVGFFLELTTILRSHFNYLACLKPYTYPFPNTNIN